MNGFPARRKLPYVMTLTAKYLAQKVGKIPKVEAGPSPAVWWEPLRAVLSIEFNHQYIDRALHNLALFLYSNAPGGVMDGPNDEWLRLTRVDMWKIWGDYVSRYITDPSDEKFVSSLVRLREDDHFFILARDQKAAFIVEFLLTMQWEKKRTGAPYLYVPSMTDVAIIVANMKRETSSPDRTWLIEHGFSGEEVDLAMEAWSAY